MNFNLKNRILPVASLVFGVMQIAIVLLSWIISSVFPSLPVRSLLGSEGVRWFLGGFTELLGSPLLVWLLLCSAAYGAFVYSGLQGALAHLLRGVSLSYRQRHALFTVLASFVVVIVVIILLAFIPHAPLLGITGNLYPGPFSAGFIPIMAFSVTLFSVVYGLTSGQIVDARRAFRCLYSGIFMFAPLFPPYILGMQLYASVVYAFF